MTLEILSKIILLGLALSMDAFAVSITDGLIYRDIDKRKSFFIASLFGFMQALMPFIGYFLVEIISTIVGETAGESAGITMSKIVTWVSFSLLLLIGFKMIIDSIKEINKPQEEKNMKLFSYKEVIYFSFATAIDALGAGVALHSNLSTNTTIYLHISIIFIITFIFSLIGLFLGRQIERILKGKYEITSIIGGTILIILAVWIVLTHYLGI